MKYSHLLVGMVGAALMGWGGSALDGQLRLAGWHRADLAIFAVGVVLLGQWPAVFLRQRVDALESALKQAAEKSAPAEQPGR